MPREEKVYVKVPKGYPPEVIAFLLNGVGKDMRDDLVELTKAGFGLPESPRLWYLQYKEVIDGLTLKELALLPGVFRSFGGEGGTKLRAMASIHVDDTRYAGDDTSGELWRELHKTLKFGKLRKATDGWVKFCGRWERQNPETFEMEYSMDDYAQGIPFVKPRGSRVSAHEDSPNDHVAPTASTPALSTTTASYGESTEHYFVFSDFRERYGRSTEHFSVFSDYCRERYDRSTEHCSVFSDYLERYGRYGQLRPRGRLLALPPP